MPKLSYRPCGLDIHTPDEVLKELRHLPSKDFGKTPGVLDLRKLTGGAFGLNILDYEVVEARVDELLNKDFGFTMDIETSESESQHFSLIYNVRTKVRRVLNSIPIASKSKYELLPDEWVTGKPDFFMPKTNVTLHGHLKTPLTVSITRFVNKDTEKDGVMDVYRVIHGNCDRVSIGAATFNYPTKIMIAEVLGVKVKEEG